MRIFLDVDGVLADFVGAALRIHDSSDPWTDLQNLGRYEVQELLGLSTSAFWEKTNNHDFWANLQMLPEGKALLSFLEKDHPSFQIYLATSPTLSPHCSSGKHAWIAKHLPNYSRRCFIGASKDVFAYVPNSLLIDDCDANIEKFLNNGGRAILWPQPWNSGYQYRNEKIEYFADAFARILNGKNLQAV